MVIKRFRGTGILNVKSIIADAQAAGGEGFYNGTAGVSSGPVFVDPTSGSLRLHYEADQIEGSHLVGSKVATWPDISTFSNNATQTTDANRPTYVSNGTGGKPAVSFGVNTQMNLGTSVNLTSSDFTVFAIINFSDTVDLSTAARFIVHYENGAQSTGLAFGAISNNIANEVISMYEYNGSTTVISSVTSITISPGASLYAFQLTGATEAISIDNVAQTVTDGTLGGLNSATGRSIGIDKISIVGSGLLGEMSALMAFDSSLSAENKTIVNDYLVSKYSL